MKNAGESFFTQEQLSDEMAAPSDFLNSNLTSIKQHFQVNF
jgi:hypothetical protein